MTNTYNVTEGTKVDNLHERDNIELTLNVPFPCEEEYTNSGFVCDDPKLKVQSEECSRIRVNTVFNQTIKSNHQPGNQDNPSVQTDYQEIVPPDGGWGWVVCFAFFMESLLFDGIFYTFGVVFLDLTDYFRSSKGVGAFISSLALGMCLLSGIFVGPLCNRFGYRIVMILGSVTTSFGLILSCFATSIRFLYVSYGIVAGLGYGMVFLPSAVAVTIYFKKKRSFATGLALCGNGLGIFIMSPFTEWLLQHYTWKGTFLVHAGLCLNGIACGLVYRPLTTNAKTNNRQADMPQSSSSTVHSILNSILYSALKLIGAAAERIKSCFVEIFDLSILKDAKFSLFVVSCFLYQLSLYVPFIYLPDLSQHKGIDAFRSAWIVSSVGLASIVSRVFVGKLTDHPNSNRLIVYAVALIVSGLVCIMLPMFDSFEAVLCLAILYGLCHGITNMLIVVLIPDLVGTQHISRGVAVRYLFSGIAALIGLPVAGWLYDVTQSYGVPFYVCGSVTAVSGLILFAIPIIDHVHRRT